MKHRCCCWLQLKCILLLLATATAWIVPASTRRSVHQHFDCAHRDAGLDDPLFGVAVEESLSKIQTLMNGIYCVSSKEGNVWLNLLDKCTKAVEVGPSSIPDAGLGLFANSPLEKGQIVSFYPVHGIGVEDCKGSSDRIAIASLDEFDQAYFETQQEENNYRMCLLGNRPLATCAGVLPPLSIDANPNRPLLPGWNSHCVNDGSVVKTNSEEGVLDYYRASLERQNCLAIPFGPSPLVATITTRGIHAGEELFTSYGSAYWMDALYRDENKTTQMDKSPRIQKCIEQSANDLLRASREAKEKYKTELDSLQSIWDNL